MAYAIAYNGLDAQTGFYARVQRVYDGTWWDNVAGSWVTTGTTDCNVSLTEGAAGVYAGTATLAPMKGGSYAINIYDADGLLAVTRTTYTADQKTALQIINEVQQELRLPQSSLITDSHAALILRFINKVQGDFMMESATWDELKISGAIGTREDRAIYYLYPVNAANVDAILYLCIGDGYPLERLTDEDFREYKKAAGSTPGEPQYYRIAGRAGNALIVELSPTPDEVYQVDYEALQKPAKLTAATDIPMLDMETIIAGAIFLARNEQGEDATVEMGAFQAKLNMHSGNQAESNFGDVEPV